MVIDLQMQIVGQSINWNCFVICSVKLFVEHSARAVGAVATLLNGFSLSVEH
jgi:hypothetical protein